MYLGSAYVYKKMSKIIDGSKQYYEVNLGSFHEPEIQRVIASKSNDIYPGFFYAPFEVLINSEYGSNKADFLLVECEYRSWWVCEVELLHHSLHEHVLPQIKTFRDGIYDEKHVEYATKKNHQIDPIRFRVLIETEHPGILVVVNRYDREWDLAIKYEGAELGIFELFRLSDRAEYIFRINGYTPHSPGELLTYVEVDQGMRRLLRVFTPSALPGHHGDIIHVAMNGVVSDWKIQLYADKAWLNPLGGHNLQADSRYKLKRSPEGTMIFETER